MVLFLVMLGVALVVAVVAASMPRNSAQPSAPNRAAFTQPLPSPVEPEPSKFALLKVALRQKTYLPSSLSDLNPDHLDRIRELVKGLPALSAVSSALIAETTKPEPSMVAIEKLAMLDPRISMDVLKTANSAAFAQASPVTSLKAGIALLGTDAVLGLALHSSLSLWAKKGFAGCTQQDLLRHNLATGLLAGALAKRNPRMNPDEAFTVGLLHDVGKLALAMAFADDAHLVNEPFAGDVGESRLGREERLFGAHHAQFGALVVRHWGIPSPLDSVIELHHVNPVGLTGPERTRDLISVVFIANQLSKYIDCAGDDREVDLADPELFRSMKLPGTYEAVLDLTYAQIERPLKALLAETRSDR